MSQPTNQPIPTQVLDGAVAAYPRDKLYIKTAIILALITLVEVATYVWPDLPLWSWGGGTNAGIIIWLLVLMAAKFLIVIGVFMHLKFDKPILWRAFASGLILAIAVYVAVMFMFRMFSSTTSVVSG